MRWIRRWLTNEDLRWELFEVIQKYGDARYEQGLIRGRLEAGGIEVHKNTLDKDGRIILHHPPEEYKTVYQVACNAYGDVLDKLTEIFGDYV